MSTTERASLLRQMLVSGSVLAVFAGIGALVLAASFEVTAPRIEDNVRATLERQLQAVLPDGIDNAVSETAVMLSEAETLQALGVRTPVTIYRADEGNQTRALVYDVTTPDGYSGDIRLLVGVAMDGVVTGVRTVSHRETPGLGDKIDVARTDWITRFRGRSLGDPPLADWQVAKDGGAFDQFSGATITPRAVVRQIARVLTYHAARAQQLRAASLQPGDDAAKRPTPPDTVSNP